MKSFEIPKHLLEQKKCWDLSVFYEYAAVVSHWLGFLLLEDEQPIGAFILYDEPLYDSVAVQTLIIDKEHRTEERVTEASIWVYRALRVLAGELGRKYIMASVRDPEKFLRRIGNPDGVEECEVVLRKKVGE